MTSRKNDKFSLFVPESETEQEMPERLEIVESGKGGLPVNRLPGGAYDPYQKLTPGPVSDAAPTRRPTDLRKLSEWIKTTKRVNSLRDGSDPNARSAPRKPAK